MSELKKRNSTTDLSAPDEVNQFLDKVKSTPLAQRGSKRGRLIFAMDATASRQATWDTAARLQSDMFLKTQGIGELDIQLLFYRGYGECRSSKWVSQPKALLKLMQSVSCSAGTTQISRVIKHALSETSESAVQALVFIGDCVEEDAEELAILAGKLRLSSLPMFIFQEGFDQNANAVFKHIAKLSGGAHCRFDSNSARQLGDLLNAVAVYAAGGKAALLTLSQSNHRAASLLLEDLNDSL